MQYEVRESSAGALAQYRRAGEPSIPAERIAEAGDFLEILLGCPTDTLVLAREDLAPDFFRLRTGLAGEFLQKLSNYRRRLVILGDFSQEPSPALQAFIGESNRTGHAVFAPDLETAARLLRSLP